MTLRVDHLVVMAHTLEQGERWCQSTLGVMPEPGGRHALMGTHNRLLRIAADDLGFTQAYLEIIAIDPGAPAPGRARWFGMDSPAQRAAVAELPRLVHWVAASDDIDADLAALRAAGFDAGQALSASRDTPEGRLQWRIAVRPDGRVLCGGALPSLIQWDDGRHPARRLPHRGVRLAALTLRGLPASARQRLQGSGVGCISGAGSALTAELHTPRGTVMLSSPSEDLG
jgi:hypothetical protein